VTLLHPYPVADVGSAGDFLKGAWQASPKVDRPVWLLNLQLPDGPTQPRLMNAGIIATHFESWLINLLRSKSLISQSSGATPP